MKHFFFIIILLIPQMLLADNMLSGIKSETPANLFNSGTGLYYFGYDGRSVFNYDNGTLHFKADIYDNADNINKPSLNKILFDGAEVFINKHAGVEIHKNTNNFSCPDKSMENCLYSNIYINKMNKKTLNGPVSPYKMDSNIPMRKKDTVNFPAGSELYSLVFEIPAFDFDTFYDFESLVCSKNEEGFCRGVISGGKLDKAALFELSVMMNEIETIFYYETDLGITYVYDLGTNELKPYDTKCFQASRNKNDMDSCVKKDIRDGTITARRHPKGIIYWEIDYKNPSMDNVYFWLNNRGEPFKAFTNGKLVFNFSVFNKQAADAIRNKLNRN